MALNARTQYRLAALARQLPGTALVTLLTLAIGGGLLWHLMSRPGAAISEQATLPVLEQQASVHWHRNGTATLQAASARDVYAALGYVHGSQRAWSLALWRQTATGRLAEWFGEGVLPLDRHARRLGLASFAQKAYAALDASQQARLESYTAGVNAALTGGSLSQHPPFALLDIDPAPWAPWHALAIERLFAWLATPPLTQTARADSVWADAGITKFGTADARFRRWLHLHSFGRSVAWAVRRDTTTFAFQRHVYGSAARAPFQPVVIEHGGPPVEALSVPGTPFLPSGKAGPQRWAFLLHSAVDLTRAPLDTAAVTVDYERIRTRDGGEELMRVSRLPGALPLGPATMPPDTTVPPPDTWQLAWPGWRPVSDVEAWHQLLALQPPSFGLLSGSGLRVEGANQAVQGDPSVVASLPGGVLVGESAWASDQARALRTRLVSPNADLRTLSRSDSSSWAADLTPQLLPSLQGLALSDSTIIAALTYLRNWDFHYDRASIGATIWGAWMQQVARRTGGRPTATDSLGRPVYRATFRAAVDTLTRRYGSDVRRWRWERIRPDVRRFPVWSADSLVAQDLQTMAATRYAPLTFPGGGHPSAPAGGASLMGTRPPTAAWEGWSFAASPLMARRRALDLDAFLERYSFTDGGIATGPLREGAPVRVTQLLPDAP